MSHTPHELAADFPEFTARIRELSGADAHFAKLLDEYHVVNRAVHRAETAVEPVAEHVEIDLRRRRMELKDQLYRRLSEDA